MLRNQKMLRSLFVCLFCSLFAAESRSYGFTRSAPTTETINLGETYTVRTPMKEPLRNVSWNELFSIKAEDELQDLGTVSALVVRPATNERKLVEELQLTRTHAIGDKHETMKMRGKEVEAVALMRSDVSMALGGYQVPGDNIHVAGLHLGKAYLKAGDLIVIQDPEFDTIKAILLMTHVSHHACWKLAARCGRMALDYLNAEGQFENGYWKYGAFNWKSGYVHGLDHRLRGVKLVVLKEGSVKVGDHVRIVQDDEKDVLLCQHELAEDYNHWLDFSLEAEAKIDKEYQAKRRLRAKNPSEEI